MATQYSVYKVSCSLCFHGCVPVVSSTLRSLASGRRNSWAPRCEPPRVPAHPSSTPSVIPSIHRVYRMPGADGTEATGYSCPHAPRGRASKPVLPSHTNLQVLCKHHWCGFFALPTKLDPRLHLGTGCTRLHMRVPSDCCVSATDNAMSGKSGATCICVHHSPSSADEDACIRAVEGAEDPERILDQAVTDMNGDLIRLRQATAKVCPALCACALFACSSTKVHQYYQEQLSCEENLTHKYDNGFGLIMPWVCRLSPPRSK